MPRPETVLPCLNWAARHASAGGDRATRRPLDVDVAVAVGLEIGRALTSSSSAAASSIIARASWAAGDHRIADPMGTARGERAHAVRTGIAVGGVDVDVLHRHAQRFGRDLPGDRLHALAEVDGRERNHELAVGIGVHQAWLGSPPRFMPMG